MAVPAVSQFVSVRHRLFQVVAVHPSPQGHVLDLCNDGPPPQSLRIAWQLEPAAAIVDPQAFCCREGIDALTEAALARTATADDNPAPLRDRGRDAFAFWVGRLSRLAREWPLLADVPASVVQQASVTLMLRLVFLQLAEARGQLGRAPEYEPMFGLRRLREQLEDAWRQHGSTALRQLDAWPRLLATFRAVHAGFDHPLLRLVPHGGQLFDPDQFAFLEGRAPGSCWRDCPSAPAPIENGTVLMLLRLLRADDALPVEELGHVYEGLINQQVFRATEPMLSLQCVRGRYAELPVRELTAALETGSVAAMIESVTGRRRSCIDRELGSPLSDALRAQWLQACDGDAGLLSRVEPFAHLVRQNVLGQPELVLPGDLRLMPCDQRRAAGSHYTPQSLTQAVVRDVLEPLVYDGPAEGLAREHWKLRSAPQILSLRICDPAMGSGAFLLQVCRYLGEHLAQAWQQATQRASCELAAHEQPADRLTLARRLVTENCLFGVDRSPMAVELARLSLWLVGRQQGRPSFKVFDQALRCGDSLVGLVRADQVQSFPPGQPHASVRPLPDLEPQHLKLVADLTVATAMKRAPAGPQRVHQVLQAVWTRMQLSRWPSEPSASDAFAAKLQAEVSELGLNQSDDAQAVSPFHWFVAFPEVAARGGFDAVVGNPPWVAFAGRAAQPIDPLLRAYYQLAYAAFRGYPTLQSLFVERACQLAPRGRIGLVVPSPLADLDGYAPARQVLTSSHQVCEPMREFGQDAFDDVMQPCFALVAAPASEPERSGRPWRLEERQRAAVEAESVAIPDALLHLRNMPTLPAQVFREMGFQSGGDVMKELVARAPDDQHTYPLLEGRDIDEFRVGQPRKFLDPDERRLQAAKCRVRPVSDYQRVKFVVRQTATHPIAALHSGLPFRNSLLAGFECDGLPAELLVGLLNSALYRAYHVANQRDARQAAFPQVKVNHLRALPQPPADGYLFGRIASLAKRATGNGLTPELRSQLDSDVFELFGVLAEDRRLILAFLAERLPHAGYASYVMV